MIHPKYEKSGEYSFNITNTKGSADATIHVSIIDRPSPPQNLTALDIRYDSLKLKWTAPAFNHGSNITKYIVKVDSLNLIYPIRI